MPSSSKKKHKTKKKDSQLIIRINTDEREQFINLCEHLDTSAAREIRHFIRDFIKQHDTEMNSDEDGDNSTDEAVRAEESAESPAAND